MISVVMPCFNCAAHLERGMRSVLSQSYRDIELILINDGSTDDSLQVASAIEDSRIIIISQSNQGVSAARNKGLSVARGRYVAFLDADDEWAPEFLEKMFARLEDRPECALAYCGWQNIGMPGLRGEPYIPPDYEGADKLATLLADCPWPIHAALTRREMIYSVGGFNPRFAIGEDFLLWLEIALSHPIVRVPEVLAYYHHHGGQQATRSRVQVALATTGVQKHFLSVHPEALHALGRKKARRVIYGTLLDRGYAYYWRRDLVPARAIFRKVMRSAYGAPKDWRYMLISLLPLSVHRKLIQLFETRQ